ncbi:MAG: cyclic nucleotide-binding domain-containing protein [Elusimicrobia bacterium]|nr:cyclic nucleotide-binding domain-containing protein [Elusimicrobiota bacterium]
MRKLTVTTGDIAEFTDIARKVDFFSQLTVGLLSKILELVMLWEYKKGEKICKQGTSGDAFYLVHSGKLRISVKKGFFSSAQVAELGRGDFFGEMALLESAPRAATVDCAEDSKVFVLLAGQFNEVAGSNPDFVANLKNLSEARKFELNQRKQ